MKLKINLLYATGIVLLIGSASVGDGFNATLPNAWGGRVLAAVLMAGLGILCWGLGRGLEIEQQSRKRRQRIERPDYRQNRRGV